MTEVTLGVTQMACSDDRATNHDKAEELVRKAAGQGANVVLVQELFEGHYFCQVETPENFARAEEPELRTGKVILEGQDVHDMASYQASLAGIQLVQEDRRIIPGLSVEENLDLATIAGEKGWDYERIYSLFPRLKERRKQEGTTLSGGEQQMLAIGRALAKELKLLLLDEPYEGLAPVVRHDIEKALMEVREAGITTIIVEQNAVAALKISDRAVILDTGEVAFSGTAKEVLDDEALRHEYLAI